MAGACLSITPPTWTIDRDYKGSDMFRPFGVTPGHALEWTRLALQMWELGGRRLAWLPEAARGLFERAVAEGWDKARGGLYYTLEWSGAPRVRDRLWWPCCEGIGAATFLAAHDGGETIEDWYTRLWEFADAPFHRPSLRRLAPAARRCAEPDRALFQRQARPLSRRASLPDPALSGGRVADAGDHGEEERRVSHSPSNSAVDR